MDVVLKLIIDDKEVEAKVSNVDQVIKQLNKESKSVSDEMSNWGNIVTGFKNMLDLARDSVNALKDITMQGAGLDTLRRNTNLTNAELELLRVATSGIVTEANLIKLSNHAKDLGLSLEQTAIFFDLADAAADKYGTTIEAGFQQIVNATEGSERGLKSIGIQKEVYKSIVDSLARSQGTTIEKLDAESQKQIRLQAIIQASGKSIDDLNNKLVDKDDKLQQLGVRVDEAKQKFGLLIAEGLIPLIDVYNKTGVAGDAVITMLSITYSTIIPLIPVVAQLKVAKALLATQSTTTATAVSGLNTSLLRLYGTMTLLVAIGVALGVGIGTVIDEIRDSNEEALNDSTAFNNKMQNQHGKALKMLADGYRNIGGEIVKVTENEKEIGKGKTVAELTKQMEALNLKIQDVVAGSDEHKKLLLEIDKINKQINPVEEKNKEKNAVDDLVVSYQNLTLLNEINNKSNYTNHVNTLAKINALLKENNTVNDQIKLLQLKKKLLDEIKAIDESGAGPSAEQGFASATNKRKSPQEQRGEQIEADLKQLATEEEVARLRIANSNDDYLRSLAELDDWYQKEMDTDAYRENYDYRLEVERAYYNERLQLKIEDMQQNDHMLNSMLDGYDTFFDTILDKQMTGSERWQSMLDSMQRYWMNYLADYIKNYIATKVAEAAVNAEIETEKTATNMAGAATRKTIMLEDIAVTLANAAASVVNSIAKAIEWQIATFGPFAIATIPASIAAIYGLFQGAKKILGFEKGGVVVGEKGPEIIAPMQDYIQGQRELVARTVFVVKEHLNQTTGLSGNGISKLEFKQIIGELTKWQRELEFKFNFDELKATIDKLAYRDQYEQS